MSITSTSLSTSISARVLEYTQPKYPIYRITYELVYLEKQDDDDGDGDMSDLDTTICSVVVEGMPDSSMKSKGYRLLGQFNGNTFSPPGATKFIRPHLFHETVTTEGVLPQSIMAELYDPTDKDGLGCKHPTLPIVRYQGHHWSKDILTIYKIERLA
jgi:hypothetical protein